MKNMERVTAYQSRRTGYTEGSYVEREELMAALDAAPRKPLNVYTGAQSYTVMRNVNINGVQLREGESYYMTCNHGTDTWLICRNQSRSSVVCTDNIKPYLADGTFVRTFDLPITPLKTARKKAGMSQGQLAKASGIGVRVIQAYEGNSRSVDGAGIATLVALAEALGCGIADIVEDADTARRLRALGGR